MRPSPATPPSLTPEAPKEKAADPWARVPVPEWLRPHAAEAVRKGPAALVRLLGEQYKGSFHKPEAILARLSMTTHGHEWLPEFVLESLRASMPLRATVQALDAGTLKARLGELCGAAGAGRVAWALWLDPRPEARELATADLVANAGAPDEASRASWDRFVSETFVAAVGGMNPCVATRGGGQHEDGARVDELRRRVREAEEALARERAARREEARRLQGEVEALGARLEASEAGRAALESGMPGRVEEAVRADRVGRVQPWMARVMAVEEAVECGVGGEDVAGLLARARAAMDRQQAVDPHAANVARLRAEVRMLEERSDEARLAVESALHRCPELEEVIRQLDVALVQRRRLLGDAPASQPWVRDLAMEVATAGGTGVLEALEARIVALAGQGLIGEDGREWLARRLKERRSALEEPALAVQTVRREASLFDVLQGRAEGRILVDTFNWIGQAGEELGVSRDPRQFLPSIRRLEPWMRRLGEVAGMADIRFVADGPHEAHRTLGRTVRVEWSGGEGKHRADKVIVGMLKAMGTGMPSWVVTDDQELAAACRMAGAMVETPMGFTRRAIKAGVLAVA